MPPFAAALLIASVYLPLLYILLLRDQTGPGTISLKNTPHTVRPLIATGRRAQRIGASPARGS